MRRALFLMLLLSAFFLSHEAEAIDPVTIAVLTPIAIKGAETAAPYVLRGLVSGGRHLVGMAGHAAEVFLIPWGVGRTVALDVGGGLGNIVQGLTAPFKLAWDAVTLPLAFCGVDVGT